MKSNGFSLIEVIIYTAIVALVFSSFVSAGILLAQLSARSHLSVEINDNAQLAHLGIRKQVIAGSGVVSPERGATTTELVLLDELGATTTISVIDGILNLNDSLKSYNLTASEVTVSDIWFKSAQSYDLRTSVLYGFRVSAPDFEGMNYYVDITSSVKSRK